MSSNKQQQAKAAVPTENTSFLSSRFSTYQSISTIAEAQDEHIIPEFKPQTSLPLGRFLSDFTLGFSDGLTVPFALTAGLSSLGRAETVIYAGFAELCAGSISMGIGGYLAALDENACKTKDTSSSRRGSKDVDVEEARQLLIEDSDTETGSQEGDDESKIALANEETVRQYLGPLNLPPHLVSDIMTNIRSRQQGLHRTASLLKLSQEENSEPLIWPVASGLSIALGYVIGGLIPLLPYFFAPTVGSGLCWSIGFCVIALFGYGFGKCALLSEERSHWRRSLWEGTRMLVLGTMAAVASVLFIKLLETSTGGPPS